MKRIAAIKFCNANGAEANRVFLLENQNTPPFLRPANGWTIVGYGKAPWPGCSDGFAVMFERVAPADEDDKNSMPEGTRIWQHMNENHFKRYVHGTD